MLQLRKMGVNMQHFKNHLRSNSVGGISSLDHQKLIQMFQENMNKKKQNEQNAVHNGQSSQNQALEEIMNVESNFPLMMQNGQNLDIEMIPLNILTREQFIDMIKKTVDNKV